MEAKRLHPGITAIGIEITPTVWLLGVLTMWWRRQKITLRCGDARKADLRDADVVFLYVTDPLMAMFEEKFDSELKPGAVVVAHAFRFPHRPAEETVAVDVQGKTQTIARYTW